MLEFIIKYWVQFLFGIVATWVVAKVKQIQKLESDKTEREQAMVEKRITEVLEQKIAQDGQIFHDQDEKLKADINELRTSINSITKGLLSMQGRQFRQYCRALLQEEHEITTAEYEQCIQDHDAYNGLGGNHRGDLLFNAVCNKYNTQISD